METYRVKVFTPGHKIVFKGKVCRSPVTFSNLPERDIAIIESQARRSSLKYEIEKESKNEKIPPVSARIQKDNIKEKVIVEELILKEPTSILEKLMAGEELENE